jgi:hypothetical protein
MSGDRIRADMIRTALEAFSALDVDRWPGLPADLLLSELEPLLAFDVDDRRPGDAGSQGGTRLWAPAESTTFAGGLRLWLGDNALQEHVLLLEGIGPVDGAGEPCAAPDLDEPDALFDAVLGPFHVRDAERVYAQRGLAFQVSPESGVLVCVLGFAPTDTDDYLRRIQPHREPTRPLPRPMPRPMSQPVRR